MSHRFRHRDVISILDFAREDLEFLFEHADKFLNIEGKLDTLKGKIVALAFFEPSTRSRLSFEVAAKKLGADVISVIGEEATSIAKGESFSDTIIMLDTYSDVIVVRHKYEGAAKYAAEVAEKPVMIDLYTIIKLFGTIDGLTYAILGDLRYSRAATSFIYGLTLFKPKKVYLVSPPLLRIRNDVRQILTSRGLLFEEKNDILEVIEEIDVLYVVRIQKERFPDPVEYERVKGSYVVTLNMLEKGKPHLKVLHPLPKVDEIDHKVDTSKYAAYYFQAKLGIPIRMSLLTLILGAE
ncbi:MAG: aspartate carbamoyltransferase [Ignisphaera sp.]